MISGWSLTPFRRTDWLFAGTPGRDWGGGRGGGERVAPRDDDVTDLLVPSDVIEHLVQLEFRLRGFPEGPDPLSRAVAAVHGAEVRHHPHAPVRVAVGEGGGPA